MAMTIEDVEWMLRYPCDEMLLPVETLNKINALISNSGRVAAGVQYITNYDANQRPVRTASTLAERKLTMAPLTGEFYDSDVVSLSTRGIVKVCVVFPIS